MNVLRASGEQFKNGTDAENGPPRWSEGSETTVGQGIGFCIHADFIASRGAVSRRKQKEPWLKTYVLSQNGDSENVHYMLPILVR